MKREDMNIVVVGHVDHGKSTIIGRLLADTDSLPKGKVDSVKEKCRRNSKPFEYAFLLDALKDEQSQGITIDSARCFFKTESRNYMIIDAPGHVEFLKNMVTGASRAEAALLVIDAFEGIQENSKRHGHLLHMLGIKQIVVLVNKMDLVDYKKEVYENISEEYGTFLSQIGIEKFNFIPVSGRNGDNLINKSSNMLWHSSESVLESLDNFTKEKTTEDLTTSRFVIVDDYEITGGGLIQREAEVKFTYEKVSANNDSNSIGENNVVWQSGQVQYEERCEIFKQKGLVVWFTGLSGAGKSTIATALERELMKKYKAVYRLDGDNLRHGLNSDLKFSEEDRNENIRRISEVALLFKNAAFITLVAVISPYEKMRRFAREKIGCENFIEVYVKADIEECMNRDPKGFYKKVKEGQITNYTGVSDPYEEPINPEIVLDTMKFSVSECVDIVLEVIERYINK